MKKFKCFVSLLLLCYCVFALAADPAPLSMLRQTADQMIASLKQNKSRIHNNPKFTEAIVMRILLPKVDVNSMSRSVLGREYWAKASSSQREAFKKEFIKLVISTYAVPLSDYNDEKIKFFPIRDFSTTAKRVQVKSQIVRNDGPPVPVNYRLVRRGSDWKVYDFSVEGVSMVQSYRSQFDGVLREKGFSGLLQQLRQHNRGAS